MKQDILEKIIENNFTFSKMEKEFPILAALKEVRQEPSYHGEGNVFTHTNMVCDELLKQKDWKELSTEDQAVLYLGGLFHDIGKITCTKIEDGTIRSKRHGIKGAKLFRSLFYREYGETISLPFTQREKIAGLIQYHGLPLWFMEKENIEYAMLKAGCTTDLRLLYLLSKADVMGRICGGKETLLERVEYFKEYGEELGIFYEKKKFANAFSRYKYFKQELLWPDTVLYDATEFEVVMMAGLPLSGKDTYVERYFDSTPVVCLDDIREEFHISPAKSSKRAVQIGKERAKEYLRKKQTFVWNATNLNRDNRNKLYDLFTSYGAGVHVMYLETPYKELLSRNEIRDRKVPVNVINHMIDGLDMIEPFEAWKVDYVV